MADRLNADDGPALFAGKTYAVFDGRPGPGRLGHLCLDLLTGQRQTWPACREGYASLERVRVREIPCSAFVVRCQHNEGRAKSTEARVEARYVSERPCFLCLANLPPGQMGIAYEGRYLILANPMPVFASHFTIAYRGHRAQSITENMGDFLGLMRAFGAGWVLLYNGPRCGASAPDHLHFQGVPSGLTPMEQEIKGEGRLAVAGLTDGAAFYRVRGVGREVVILEGKEPAAVEGAFGLFMEALKKVLSTPDEPGEPMVSVAGLYDGENWRVLVYPRAKHRPDAFFMEGDDRIVVSPAVVEMCGVLVTPSERDFERLTGPAVEAIYREVSMDAQTVERALGEIL